jgi:hypothetical protein
LIPAGDELASAITDEIMTLKEWKDYVFVTPDIVLEKEMQWPVD